MTITVLGLALAAAASTREAAEMKGGELYDHLRERCVELLVDGHLEGSAWIADTRGTIVTSAHGFWSRPEARLEAVSHTIPRVPVEIVAWDRGHDLALLRLPAREEPYPFLEVLPGDTSPGDPVRFFGQAGMRHEMMLPGIVTRRDPVYEFDPQHGSYTRVIHIAGPSPPGSSGGCWVDLRGRVVASQSGFINFGGTTGIAWAAPAEAIRNLNERGEDASTPTLGVPVEELVEQPADRIRHYPAGAAGVVFPRVPVGSPAARAGVDSHMLITALDGKTIRTRDEFLDLVRAREPGAKVTLRAQPAGIPPRPRDIEVTLGELEVRPGEARTEPRPDDR